MLPTQGSTVKVPLRGTFLLVGSIWGNKRCNCYTGDRRCSIRRLTVSNNIQMFFIFNCVGFNLKHTVCADNGSARVLQYLYYAATVQCIDVSVHMISHVAHCICVFINVWDDTIRLDFNFLYCSFWVSENFLLYPNLRAFYAELFDPWLLMLSPWPLRGKLS